MKQLTIKEALEQGYTLCGKDKDGWSFLNQIADMQPSDFDHRVIYIASKEFTTPSIDESSLRNLVAEHIEDDWSSETGDDTEEVHRAIKKLDFTQFADMINKAIEDNKAYKFTDIELTL